MSRYFETLREVSRSQGPIIDTPANGKNGEAARDTLPLVDLPEPVLPPLPDLPGMGLYRGNGNGAAAAPEPAQQAEWTVRTLPIRLDKKIPLMPHTDDNSIVEQYRKLRTKIQQEHATKPIRSLLVASPGPNEGKTITVMNLALIFAMLPDFKVLAIDGDLRKGSIAQWLGVKDQPGLSNLIDGSATLEEVVFKGEDLPLNFMVAGTSAKPSAELLTSPRLKEAIRQASERFDLVVVDSSPVNLITDAQMLAGSCDAILLVARAFSTTSKALQKTLAELSSYRLMGTVLNGGMRARDYKSYYGY